MEDSHFQCRRSVEISSICNPKQLRSRTSTLGTLSHPLTLTSDVRQDLPMRTRNKEYHPHATTNSIKASKDFVRTIAYRIDGKDGKNGDTRACVSTVVQPYKNFTAGWQWAGNEKIKEKVTLSTSNVTTSFQQYFKHNSSHILVHQGSLAR